MGSKFLERRLQKDDTLQKRYQEAIDTDVKARCVRKIDQYEPIETTDNGVCHITLSTTLMNPKKRESNAAAKYQGVALSEKILSGKDLLQSPIGWPPMCTMSLACTSRADYEYKRHVFWDEELANLCKLCRKITQEMTQQLVKAL